MKPPPFTYYSPATVAETIGLLASLENAMLLAGGQSLMPMLNMRYALPDQVIDLNHVDGLNQISESGGWLEIGAMADVPGRTGLGSSGSFTVALLAALREHQRLPMPRQQLAEEAFHVETVRAGQPAGKHDHYLGAFGGLTCLEIDTAGDVTVSALDISLHTLDELRNSMVVFFTGMVRESFDILSQQEADTAAGEPDVVDSLHQVKELGLQIRSALQEGNPDRFGELLHVHWEAKKRRSTKVSNPKIDAYYETGRRQGALGGKLLGAGGGGFLMFYCPAEFRGQLREAMTSEGLQEMSFQFDTDGAKVLMNA